MLPYGDMRALFRRFADCRHYAFFFLFRYIFSPRAMRYFFAMPLISFLMLRVESGAQARAQRQLRRAAKSDVARHASRLSSGGARIKLLRYHD